MKNKLHTAETHPLTWWINAERDTVWFKEYRNKNGYKSVEKVFNNFLPIEIINLVKDSGLKGRGGAGFLTGVKWSLMSENTSLENRYLICNADEMEPGTYKDKFLMEYIPHQLIEGILLGAFALQVKRAYIFLRGEYFLAEKILHQAIYEANQAGFLGKNILDSGIDVEIILHSGAGRYLCGEETALINSLEGKRANPRAKPPFPATVGLWGKPTCVNNVETLSNIPAIVLHGIQWYKNLSNSDDTGTKIMGFSGKVNNSGLWELPLGITARELLYNYAGGMQSGLKLKAWQPGGASTSFLTEEHLDIKMDFSSFNSIGSRLGTGLAMAVDNTVNMVSLVLNLEKFFSRESCGLCTPCRDGLPWVVKILQALEQRNGSIDDIELLEDLCKKMGPGKTFCAHAPGAVSPLQSAIKYFRSDFENGLNKNKNDNNIRKIDI
ncbi:NADH-quinone oxidoreductase subunit NuoF [Buchnera aphidicola (Pemphigus obesinymphae)]|uniref:NADH-quinone oxidoreductase subunit NuoF n=1 Tax=Buchnera aphidicola TaxID=9 RepID=UPI0022375A82|nr:NADH-quinone oxidoreductase subunit NuoF [Buchnera aphidicola]MCW5196567.1 NADH-quinone oxidoreductase subunit NuoF [Buchnera aphidicola (Pemphigus obesinymphae)]